MSVNGIRPTRLAGGWESYRSNCKPVRGNIRRPAQRDLIVGSEPGRSSEALARPPPFPPVNRAPQPGRGLSILRTRLGSRLNCRPSRAAILDRARLDVVSSFVCRALSVCRPAGPCSGIERSLISVDSLQSGASALLRRLSRERGGRLGLPQARLSWKAGSRALAWELLWAHVYPRRPRLRPPVPRGQRRRLYGLYGSPGGLRGALRGDPGVLGRPWRNTELPILGSLGP